MRVRASAGTSVKDLTLYYAEFVADVALANPRVSRVQVTVRKRPPVQGLELAGIQITGKPLSEQRVPRRCGSSSRVNHPSIAATRVCVMCFLPSDSAHALQRSDGASD